MSVIRNTINNSSSTLTLGNNPGSVAATTPLAVGNNTNNNVSIELSNTTTGDNAGVTLQCQSDAETAYFGINSSTNSDGSTAGRAYVKCAGGISLITNNNSASISIITGNEATAANFTNAQILTLTNPLPVGSGGTGVASPTAHSLPVAEGSSAFTFVGPLTNGQLLIGSTGADPVAAAITAGTGITISNAAGSITVNSTGGGVTWSTISDPTLQAVVDNGYITTEQFATVTITLPVTGSLGQSVSICGQSADGWIIAQNSGQQIFFGSDASTTGTGGSLASTNQYDSVTLRCVVPNSGWQVVSSVGNLLLT